MTAIEIPLNELPAWMLKARRTTDWGALVIAVLSLALAWPFLFQPGLPHTNSSENHVYMSAEFATALREGRLYPRWSADALNGYGAPIPNFYPPGGAYTAALLQIFFTGTAVNAVRVVYIAALCMAGSAVYTLVTRRAGSASGLLAGLLYAYSPYVGHTAPHIMGDYSGVIGLALLPALLWSVDRLLATAQRRDITLVAVILALLIVSSPVHVISALGLSALMGWIHERKGDGHWLRLGLSIVIGGGLASFYWIPALLDQQYIQWIPSEIALMYRLEFPAIIEPLRRVDLEALFPLPHFTIGLPLVLAVISSGVFLLIKRQKFVFQSAFLAVGVGLLIVSVVFFADQSWILGTVTLCLAIGGSLFWRPIEMLMESSQRLLLPISVIVILTLALPVWAAPKWSPVFGRTDEQTRLEYERSGYGIAVLPRGGAIPSPLPALLPADPNLMNGYASNRINKINSALLALDTRIGLLQHNTHNDRFQLQTGSPTTLHLLTSFFPGWQATAESIQFVLEPNPSNGLIRIHTPLVNNSELLVNFGTTPLRMGAWILSGVMILATLLVLWGRFDPPQKHYPPLRLIDVRQARLIMVVVVAFLLLLTPAVLTSSPWIYLNSGHGMNGSTPFRNRTDAGLEVLAYRLDDRIYRQGETLDLMIYWRALRVLRDNFRVNVFLTTLPPSTPIATVALRHPGGYPTSRWTIGRYVSDPYQIQIPDDLPTGRYFVGLEVIRCTPDCQPNSRLNFFDSSGSLAGQILLLPQPIMVAD